MSAADGNTSDVAPAPSQRADGSELVSDDPVAGAAVPLDMADVPRWLFGTPRCG